MRPPAPVSGFESASSSFNGERRGRSSASSPSPAAGGRAGVGGLADRDASSGMRPRKGISITLAAASAPPRAERVADLAAMRAGIAGHVLDQADHRHVHLAEHVDRAGGVDQRRGPAGSRRSPRRPASISGSASSGRRRCRAADRRSAARNRPSRPPSGWPSALAVIGPRQATAVPGSISWPIESICTPCAGDRDDLLVGRARGGRHCP